MPRSGTLAAAVIFAALLCLGCSSNDRVHRATATVRSRSSGDHLAWAERLVGEVTPETNTYASSPTTVTWAGVNGARETRNRSVCSTLVTALFEQAYGYSADDMIGWLGASNPTAAEFYAAISSSRGFSQVGHVGELAPGDILAVMYPAGSHPTGHVMVVEQPPAHRAASAPIIAGTEQYEVVVIDSSSSGHGPGDTRSAGGGKFRSGVGRGTLRLYVDSAGTITGYSWSTIAASRFVSHTEHPLLVGRFDRSLPPGKGRQGRAASTRADEDVEPGPDANGP